MGSSVLPSPLYVKHQSRCVTKSQGQVIERILEFVKVNGVRQTSGLRQQFESQHSSPYKKGLRSGRAALLLLHHLLQV